MKSVLLFAALLLPSLGTAATLTGSVVNSFATIDLPSVGTLDWARWPGYSNKAGMISNIKTTGFYETYTTDPRIIGTRNGVRVSGSGASFEFTVPATTQERTLIYYLGAWTATGRLSVTLPGAPTYTVDLKTTGTLRSTVTIKFRGDAAGVLRVRYTKIAGTGNVSMQAAALQGAGSSPTPPAPVSGSALLTWTAPAQNTNGTLLTNLAGFRVYWGTTQGNYSNSIQISNASTRTHTVSGLGAGRWYFAVTAVNSAGVQSGYSNIGSKLIQ